MRRTGAGMAHNLFAFFVRDFFGQVLSIALKSGDDIQRMPIPFTGPDGPTINHDRRSIQAAHGHDTARHVLVAARNRDQGVVPLRPHNGLHRIGDEITRLKGVAHTLGPHRDTIRDADRVEPHADHAGLLDPLLDGVSQSIEVHIAGIALVPDTANADLGLVHIVRRKPRGVEHGLRGALALGLRDAATVFVELCCHGFAAWRMSYKREGVGGFS